MSESQIDSKTAPMQIVARGRRYQGTCATRVHIDAYEVYCHIFGPQPALITDGCRSGFSISELVCFLYAKSYPKTEWKLRFDEAIRGMDT